jgi:RNA-binding protein YlmH
LIQRENIMLEAFLRDCTRRVEKTHQPVHTRFLDPLQQRMTKELLRKSFGIGCIWCGGYEDAERCVAIFFQEGNSDLEIRSPVSLLRVAWNKRYYRFSHRDVLGALMSLGLIRENIGDILVDEDGAFIFVLDEIVDFLLLHLLSIGKASVKVEKLAIEDFIPPVPKTKELRTTVPSLRLDAIVAAAYGISRSKALPLIQGGYVRVNWDEVLKPDKILQEGDVISVKKKGRAKIRQVGDFAKKGRIAITIILYK